MLLILTEVCMASLANLQLSDSKKNLFLGPRCGLTPRQPTGRRSNITLTLTYMPI
jgi:hypothetical protein